MTMFALTRRRDTQSREESWKVYYRDIHVGTIGKRSGIPNDVDPWGWICGFYPGSEPGEHRDGTGATFDEARAGFEEACQTFLAQQTEADFRAYRNHRAFTAWKFRMWDTGMKMPTEIADDRSHCFCGAVLTTATTSGHIEIAHLD
jgi:hypothetical protein